jgi:hypothetical protein
MQCVKAMMTGHPFALAWIPGPPPRLIWIDMDGSVRGI